MSATERIHHYFSKKHQKGYLFKVCFTKLVFPSALYKCCQERVDDAGIHIKISQHAEPIEKLEVDGVIRETFYQVYLYMDIFHWEDWAEYIDFKEDEQITTYNIAEWLEWEKKRNSRHKPAKR